MIKEIANAKINLSLNVIGKRTDGFHNLESIMLPLDFYDELVFEESEEDVVLGCSIADNIIIKAIKLFKEHFNIQDKYVKITLDKKIFIAAGLAGGSADAAATLKGLNRLWHVNASQKDLLKLSEHLGSDVPFTLLNKVSIARGRGELLTPIYSNLECYCLLINPRFKVSTPDVFKEFKIVDSSTNDNLKKITEGLINNDLELINNYIFNDLEAATFRLYPDLKRIKQEIETKTKLKIMMSGSGPTLFILNKNSKLLENIANVFNKSYDVIIKKVKNN
ncbi:MAG: 4-(cytidine 5'-diphospho)-2-C-methyl-D-erythritol kinase [Erysipelotrichales bacterium]|nr:4-(cytidine 5'-diphospho)-2-C-methyl-D-erythritol kinase [Erysipelotrichales bacterium]